MKKVFIVLMLIGCVFYGFAGGQNEGESSEVVYTEAGTFPIVETTVDLTFMVSQAVSVEDYNTNEFSLFMKEKTNVDVDWKMVPEQARKEKLSLVLASGDYPDVFLGFDMSADQEATYGMEEGLLLPLNKYIDTVMPNLKKILDENPAYRGHITSTDGNIYSLPQFSECYHCVNSQKMWIYEPFLDALGMDVPTTTEEFYEYLVAVRDQDPNGNGKADEISLVGSIKGWRDQVELFIINSFIYSDLDTNIESNAEDNVGFYMDGNTVDTSLNKDAYREALRYLSKLYKEGLIYEGSFSQDNTQLTQLVESSIEPTVATATGGWRGMYSSFDGERFKNYRAIAPLKGPKGIQTTVHYYQTPSIGNFAVSADSKNPEAALRWADYLYSTEGTLNLTYGFEGKAWRWAEDGEVGLDGNPAIFYTLVPWNDKDPQNVTYLGGGVYAKSSAFRLGEAVDLGEDYYSGANNAKELYDDTKNLYIPYDNPIQEMPSLRYTADEQAEFASVKSEYAKYVRQATVKFIVGVMDVETDWDTYLEDLETLGLTDLLKLRQTAYDRQFR